MERRKFTREFKLEAVRLIKERGVSYAQAEQDLSVHQSQLRSWVKAFAGDPQHAFPGQGQMKPEQAEIARLKREVTKLKAERDILKKAGLLREGIDVKFSFIAKHRGTWPTGWLCGALGVSRGGFYAWLTRPRSQRSQSDEELSAKVRGSFLASDRTYGARRVWHDLQAEPFATGLKATDPSGRGRALVACGKASRRSRLAQGKAAKEARAEALIRALDVNSRCLCDLKAHRQGYTKGRAPSALELRIEGLLLDLFEWSVRRLETFVPATLDPAQPAPRPPVTQAPRYDPDDFRLWSRQPG